MATARSDFARLEVENLAVGIGKRGPLIVGEVSLQVRAGEVLGLLGESGSGKTTVALALSAYTRRGLMIRAGEIRLNGTNLLQLSTDQLRGKRGAEVAYVPQDPAAALNPALRIGTQLREELTVHGVADPDARMIQVLDEVRLDASPEMLRRYPHQLSGGQQQRVALAIAFACRPSLIVLDEPTTGLDVSTQRHVLETVRNLCRSYGVAGVYVSHDLAVVSQLVSEVAVMYAGRVIETGAARDVLGSPFHPYTRGLVDAVPRLEGGDELIGIKGQPPRPHRRPAGCAFAPRCSYAQDRCRTQQPAPTAINGREVRCHRVHELNLGVRAAVPLAGRSSGGDRSSEPLLAVRDLSASYGSKQVLFSVDLHVDAETCVAVVGESGSGKTTLARCIVGMHDRWTGTVSYEGTPLAHSARERPANTLRRVQYIFQSPYASLNPRKTIGQILAQPLDHFFQLSSAHRNRRIGRALEDVSLGTDFVTRYPDELSGGERQRVAIARALLAEPDLLVCDEVTSALDVSVQAVIIELLRSLQQKRRLSMIFITHNVALVRSIAQSAVVLYEGKVVESGGVDDLVERPTDPYAVRLMNDVPVLNWRTEDAPGKGAPSDNDTSDSRRRDQAARS
jgi:peptide/nickel transport system ATP-binding protein